MKKYIIVMGLLTLGMGFTSCKKYLEENPQTFITPDQFFQTENQIKTAVDGAYKGLERPYTSIFLGLPLSEYWSIEPITGFSTNPFGGAAEQQFKNLSIDPRNDYLKEIFLGVYTPVLNINNAIINIEKSTILTAEVKSQYLGQLYFLRAWHYFHGVQLMGEIPLITEVPKSIKDEDLQVPKATKEKIYAQIVADLQQAEKSGLPYKDVTGHVNMGAVKGLLAKVYLTMAGYPLDKKTEYYNLAYQKAKELIDVAGANGIDLFPNYADLRSKANHNIGEHLFMVQRRLVTHNSEMHYGMLPSPGKVTPDISKGTVFDTALLPTLDFYHSYDAGDKRVEDYNYFYAYLKNTDGSAKEVMNYKCWDPDAAVSGNGSGANIPLLRYADVLLICAEASAGANGGTTSDATALSAYYKVRDRALPGKPHKGSITADEILMERFHELAFEYISWYDMLRTRKTLDPVQKKIVPLIGFQGKEHPRAITESDLIFPLPTQEVLTNPKLLEPAQ